MLRFLLAAICASGLLVGCPSPVAAPGSPDGDASFLLDAGEHPSACGALCANLARVGCNPTIECVEACSNATLRGLVAVDAVACASSAPTRAGVQSCAGGFCR